jgi:polar amino acid transport system substrate-binding protein
VNRMGLGRLALVSIAVCMLVTSCSSSSATTSASSASPAGDPTTDKLAQVLARGTLILSTDRAYPPQSFGVDGATRATDTKCAASQLTRDEVAGYDADTGKLVADALGVEPCFVEPTWTEITGGNWGDRWDISYGSGSINEDRMQRLWMTQPYYAVPNVYFVREDSAYQQPSDLDGKEVGACASCSHEYYLRGELKIPGVEIVQSVNDPQIVTFNTEEPGLRAVAKGKLDAFLAAAPVGQALIDEGVPLRPLDEVAFTYYPSGFVDKGSGLSSAAFVDKINEIIRRAQADGSFQELSMKYFGTDYATPAASFDLDAIGQNVT